MTLRTLKQGFTPWSILRNDLEWGLSKPELLILLVWGAAKELEFLASSQLTLMPLVCGLHFENLTTQRKETLNRAASDSASILKSINASCFQSFFFFFRNCGIPFVTTPSTSSPKLWFKKLIKVINVYLKQVKSFLFMEYTGFYSGLLPPDTLSRPFTPPPHRIVPLVHLELCSTV